MDDRVGNYIADNIKCFEKIHPNIITIGGMVLNIVLYALLFHSNDKLTSPTVCLILSLRYIADMLDGAVARKYNKKSKIGGILDSSSDIMLYFVCLMFIVYRFKLSKWTYILWIIVTLFFLIQYNSFSDHDSLKKTNGNLTDIIPFLTNNCILLYIVFIIIYLKYKHK